MDIYKNIRNLVLLSAALTLTIIVIFIIVLGCSGENNAVSKGISMFGDYFGGFATIVAACIAAQLFNDWRIQHNKQILATEAKETFNLFHKQRDYLNNQICMCKNIISGKEIKKISWAAVANQYEEEFLPLYNKDKDAMAAFCFLSEGQIVHTLTNDYFKTIEDLAGFLSKKRNVPNSDFIFLNNALSNELLELIQNIYNRNSDVLNELKTYIFVPVKSEK
ncbi:hypothetical protein M5F04_04930 [Acinetobacter sp. ANC 7200]|uniref:hypothetical protein n=1 Tax=Acinetobacter TaxID=469 RepID=UPI0015D22E20|nr:MULTISPECIES: hypothetical protein [Acinetobacter]MCL6243918.1 hypothetical protein [Acinetobacter amyesii]